MQQGTGNMPRASVLGSSGSLGMQSFELGGGDGRQRPWHHGTDVFPGECDGQSIRVHTASLMQRDVEWNARNRAAVGWAAAAASAGSLARKREKESAAAGVAARRVSRMAVQAGTAARKAAEVKAAAAIVPHEPRRSLEAGAAAARAPNQDELSGSSSERSGSAPPRPEAAAAAAGSSVRFASSAPRYALLPSPSCCFHTAQQLCTHVALMDVLSVCLPADWEEWGGGRHGSARGGGSETSDRSRMQQLCQQQLCVFRHHSACSSCASGGSSEYGSRSIASSCDVDGRRLLGALRLAATATQHSNL